MKRTLWTVVVACCMMALGALPSTASENISRITDAELMTVLKEEGYAPSLVKPGLILVKMAGIKVLFLVWEDNESIQAYAGFESDDSSLKRINEWNRKRRLSRAYVDDDGDAVIELDLDLAGGVSKERLLDFISTTEVSVLAFALHMTFENSSDRAAI